MNHEQTDPVSPLNELMEVLFIDKEDIPNGLFINSMNLLKSLHEIQTKLINDNETLKNENQNLKIKSNVNQQDERLKNRLIELKEQIGNLTTLLNTTLKEQYEQQQLLINTVKFYKVCKLSFKHFRFSHQHEAAVLEYKLSVNFNEHLESNGLKSLVYKKDFFKNFENKHPYYEDALANLRLNNYKKIVFMSYYHTHKKINEYGNLCMDGNWFIFHEINLKRFLSPNYIKTHIPEKIYFVFGPDGIQLQKPLNIIFNPRTI